MVSYYTAGMEICSVFNAVATAVMGHLHSYSMLILARRVAEIVEVWGKTIGIRRHFCLLARPCKKDVQWLGFIGPVQT